MLNPYLTLPNTYGGMKIFVTEQAVTLPSKKPRTLDMRLMVDHLEKTGQIKPFPAILQCGDTLWVHPEVKRKIDKQIRESIEFRTDTMFFNALKGVFRHDF